MTTVCLPDAQAQAAVGALPGVEVVLWDGAAPASNLDRVEFFVPPYTVGPAPSDLAARLPRLRVIQLLSAGVEPWLRGRPPGVLLCSGRGVHGASTAELAVAGLISVLRDLPRFAAAQAAHEWLPARTAGLAGARVLVLGAGDIGHRVAAAVEAFDAEVTVVARRARAGVRALGDLPDLLGGQDAVVVALPLTPETARLVDATFLGRLPDGAVLVNVARGAIVDTDALLAELDAGRLRAFLDVTDPEPLPPQHPLWDAPGLLLTPHIGGGTHGWQRRAYGLVRQQILRFRDGEELVNLVGDQY